LFLRLPIPLSQPAVAPAADATSEPTHIRAARYVWALLLARIYEVLPLLWPARRAQLWETPGRESGEIDPQAQPEPNYEFDLRVAW